MHLQIPLLPENVVWVKNKPLVCTGERVSITDLDSTNGTFVDGKEIVAGEEELLPLGSEVIFGKLMIGFHSTMYV